MTEEPKPLTPPDIDRCQAEKHNGYNFMTFGGVPGMVRCENEPTVIVFELELGDDGQRGAMSVCNECLEVMAKQMDMQLMAVFRKEAESG